MFCHCEAEPCCSLRAPLVRPAGCLVAARTQERGWRGPRRGAWGCRQGPGLPRESPPDSAWDAPPPPPGTTTQETQLTHTLAVLKSLAGSRVERVVGAHGWGGPRARHREPRASVPSCVEQGCWEGRWATRPCPPPSTPTPSLWASSGRWPQNEEPRDSGQTRASCAWSGPSWGFPPVAGPRPSSSSSPSALSLGGCRSLR